MWRKGSEEGGCSCRKRIGRSEDRTSSWDDLWPLLLQMLKDVPSRRLRKHYPPAERSISGGTSTLEWGFRLRGGHVSQVCSAGRCGGWICRALLSCRIDADSWPGALSCSGGVTENEQQRWNLQDSCAHVVLRGTPTRVWILIRAGQTELLVLREQPRKTSLVRPEPAPYYFLKRGGCVPTLMWWRSSALKQRRHPSPRERTLQPI